MLDHIVLYILLMGDKRTAYYYIMLKMDTSNDIHEKIIFVN